jgi:hypothetical protein
MRVLYQDPLLLRAWSDRDIEMHKSKGRWWGVMGWNGDIGRAKRNDA